MKKIVVITIFLLINLLLSAQRNNKDFDKLIVSYNGDSTLLIEKYEIDILKKKVFYITPIMNYLHIKGKKYRTKLKIQKQKWTELEKVADTLFSLMPDTVERFENKDIIYSIEFFNSSNKINGLVFYNESIPRDFKRLFYIIRENN